ncbi:MAG: hypothetical protein FJ029_00945 [Actinobacteria bacterium]|nr:hypothetical protein [Actinomycetota bacterium]
MAGWRFWKRGEGDAALAERTSGGRRRRPENCDHPAEHRVTEYASDPSGARSVTGFHCELCGARVALEQAQQASAEMTRREDFAA